MTKEELLLTAKPILFNTEMVRAILDGRKTTTRRCVKFLNGKNPNWTGYVKDGLMLYNGTNEPCIKPCQYQSGDILYVRETWEHFDCCSCEGDEHGNCPKEPKKSVLDKYGCGCYMYRATDEISGDAKWHPSIHMPKEAARIFLKVTDMRVEQLQDMNCEDYEKEGLEDFCKKCSALFSNCDTCLNDEGVEGDFKELWNSTIKKSDLDTYGWDSDPWVWVIEFERIIPD